MSSRTKWDQRARTYRTSEDDYGRQAEFLIALVFFSGSGSLLLPICEESNDPVESVERPSA